MRRPGVEWHTVQPAMKHGRATGRGTGASEWGREEPGTLPLNTAIQWHGNHVPTFRKLATRPRGEGLLRQLTCPLIRRCTSGLSSLLHLLQRQVVKAGTAFVVRVRPCLP